MAAGVEQGVELGGTTKKFLERLSVLPKLLLGKELLGRLVVGKGFDGARVEGSYPALGGGEDELCLGL